MKSQKKNIPQVTKNYDHQKIEPKWRKIWDKTKLNKTKDDFKKKKFYILDMFPYPSGEGLHVGHPRGFIATDVYSRYKKMHGFNVLHPMGWDAFGLPAENYAIKNKTNPVDQTAKNVKRYKEQASIIGFNYDWDREVNTTDPKYYKWTQWIFLQLLKKGLAYESYAPINWCPSCKTGLANEDLENGKCERCGSDIEKKPMRQWVLKITDYADRLLNDIDDLNWPESIKESQRNWIGRSEGINFHCKIKDLGIPVEMFNSVPQSYHAETFTVIAPDHPLVAELVRGTPREKEVLDFVEQIKLKKLQNRFDVENDMEGIFTGRYIEKFADTGRDLPIWIASYVLADYGTGIVNASAHDTRDFAFAKKYNIPLRVVTIPEDAIEAEKVKNLEICHARDTRGIMLEPQKFAGRRWGEVRADVIEHIAANKLGSRKINYKLKDWVFSRQRYWGEPIPVVHCERCGIVPVPESELPVILPKVKFYEPTGTGESPLANIEKWVNTKCPKCVAEKNKPKYLIFDFDGVLADTFNETIYAHTVIANIGHDEAEKKMMKYFSNLPDHTRSSVRTKEQIAEHDDFINRFGKIILDSKFKLFTNFIREVQKYKNAKIAVVSSGSKQYVLPAVKKSGLKVSHVLASEDNHSKEEKIERVCKDWGIDIGEAYYFTDTKADVYELQKMLASGKLIGCAWGFQGLDGLREVLPEKQILKDFKDLHRVLNLDCKAKRETNTMPQWAGSSWYYLRYMDPKNSKALVDSKKEKYWAPVDLYVGGTEHATRHLIYARFWHKFLYDIGVVSSSEPFMQLKNQGMILGSDNRKMSKRWGNVVNPDEVVKNVGADTLRVYEMFMGPFDQEISWSTDNMVGSRRFLERVWKLQEKVSDTKSQVEDKNFEMILHRTIKKVTEDILGFNFNTVISALMILINAAEKTELSRTNYEIILKLLAPFAPHVTEEIWANLGNKKSIHIQNWPDFDAKKIVSDNVTVVVQINGKPRANFDVVLGTSQADVEKIAYALPEVSKWLAGKQIKKVMFIKEKILSIITD